MTEDIESGYLSWKECFSLPILLSCYQLIILAMIEIHESPLENKNSQKKKTQTESFYVKRNVSWSSCVPVPGLAFCVPKQWVITDKSSRGQVEFYFRPQKSRHFSKRKKKCWQTKWASAGLFVSGPAVSMWIKFGSPQQEIWNTNETSATWKKPTAVGWTRASLQQRVWSAILSWST